MAQGCWQNWWIPSGFYIQHFQTLASPGCWSIQVLRQAFFFVGKPYPGHAQNDKENVGIQVEKASVNNMPLVKALVVKPQRLAHVTLKS